jgi:integrase/recombinase XerD
MTNFTSNIKQLNTDDYFTQSELTELASNLKKDRDSLLIKTALVTGARQGELILLHKRHLNLTNGTIYITANKGSNDREIRVSKDLIALLQQLPTDQLFPICESRVRYIWDALRPKTITRADNSRPKKFHALRHTFGVELYRATKDIMLVKKAMGHKALTSTLVYVECVNYADQMDVSYKALDDLMK